MMRGWMIKPRQRLPLLIAARSVPRQRGAALIAAIFVITGLLVLGGLMTRLLVSGTEETLNEWYSAQALYAAESGVEWSIYNSGASVADQALGSGTAWYTVAVVQTAYGGGRTLYTITSTGKAGGTAGTPRSQRQIVVQFMP